MSTSHDRNIYAPNEKSTLGYEQAQKAAAHNQAILMPMTLTQKATLLSVTEQCHRFRP